jgi:hypothetical protein
MYVDLEDLEKYDGTSAGKYVDGEELLSHECLLHGSNFSDTESICPVICIYLDFSLRH